MPRSSRLQAVCLFALLTAAGCGSDQDAEPINSSITNNGGTNNGGTNNGTNNGGTNNGGTNNGGSDQAVTYYEHIKPILDARCTSCHVDGGIGPFPLTSYEEAKAVRTSIRAQVGAKTMPPWLAGDQCTEYKHDYSLTDEQIDLVDAWVEQDTPEGDASNEGDALPEIGGGLSRVDLTLQMPETYTPQQSPDDYRCFPIEWPEDSAKFVTGFGVNPGDQETVHHVIAFLAGPELSEEVAQKDAAEDGPGYTCFGAPGVGTQDPTDDNAVTWLGSWAPGGQGHDFPENTGIEVQPGSTVILQVHYNTLTTDPAPDQSEVMVKLEDQVEKPALYIPWANPQWLNGDSMMIPAGTSDTTHSFAFDIVPFVGQDVQIHDVAFHMHNLGETGRLWIKRADGSEDCLLDIPQWDFDWQFGYRLKQPRTLTSGDQLAIECQWDNTAENQPVVDGQRLQPRDVTWGDGTTDEMCLGLFYVTFE